MLDWLGSVIGDWLNGLGNLIGDLTGNIPELLSSIVGIIPRSIVFIRSLFQPITTYINNVFPSGITGTIFGTSTITIIFTAVIGFIVAVGIRRAVVK